MTIQATDTSFWSTIASYLGFGGLLRRFGRQQTAPGAYAVSAAKTVTFDTAMQVSAFWACARILAETIACLPFAMMKINADGTATPDRKHPLYQLLSMKPNRYQTRIEFFESLMLNLATHGNFYGRIERNVVGDIVSIIPLPSSQVITNLLPDGSKVYEYHTDGGVVVYAESSIWHIPLFGNGLVGLSPLAFARNSIGIAQAAEDRVTSIYRNGAKPTGILMLDKPLSKLQRDKIRESFSDLAEGNSDSLIVLESFMKYEQVSMNPAEVELLATRRFQLEDIARFMGVPSVLINDTSATTVWGSGIQQLIDGAFKLNFRPYLERIELSVKVHLLSVEDRANYDFKFDFDNLLRMDKNARITSNGVAINSGQLTPNEARADEGRPPVPGGDKLLIQGALIPIDQAGATPKPGEQSGFGNQKPVA